MGLVGALKSLALSNHQKKKKKAFSLGNSVEILVKRSRREGLRAIYKLLLNYIKTDNQLPYRENTLLVRSNLHLDLSLLTPPCKSRNLKAEIIFFI